jgi:hypothetical protein
LGVEDMLEVAEGIIARRLEGERRRYGELEGFGLSDTVFGLG